MYIRIKMRMIAMMLESMEMKRIARNSVAKFKSVGAHAIREEEREGGEGRKERDVLSVGCERRGGHEIVID